MAANSDTKKSSRKKHNHSKAASLKRYSANRWDLPKPLLAILDEHKYVNRLLPLLEAEALRLQEGKKADYQCMADIMHYMTHFPDRYHHPKEDLIFARMIGASTKTTKTVAKTVEKLQHDHTAMAANGAAIYAQIVAQQTSSRKAKRQRLAEDILFYASELRDHMRREETEVFQPAWKSLQKSDWQAVDAAIEPINDPLFGDTISERYLELVQRYINNFNSVYSRGSFPVQLVESTASAVEQAVYAIGGMRHLPKQLAGISGEVLKDQIGHCIRLAQVRDLAGLEALAGDINATGKDGVARMLALIKEARDAVSKQLDVEAMHSGLATITLHTEKELRSFQERPYEPSEKPQLSWQAGLMNLVARAAIKPMMGKRSLDDMGKVKRLNKPSAVVPPGTLVSRVAETAFHADWIVPEGLRATKQTILHLPGGGFFAPASSMHRRMLGKLACRLQARVMLVNYRLLPEHPFPAGLEDALAAYHYLLDDGVKPEDIIIAGDSAGGCLALAMMFALRDEGRPLPAAGVLLSPLTDLTSSTAARQANRWKDPMLPAKRDMGAYEKYAGAVPGDDPRVSPIYGSFTGLPPLFALVSSTETLLDDTLVVARKARAEGVDIDVEVWQNLPHDWPIFGFIPEANVAIERVAEFCEQHFNSYAA